MGLNPLPVESDSISELILSKLRWILRHPAGVQELLVGVGKYTHTHTPPPLELSPELLLPCNEEHTPFCFDLYILRGGVYKASQKQEFQKIDLSYHY